MTLEELQKLKEQEEKIPNSTIYQIKIPNFYKNQRMGMPHGWTFEAKKLIPRNKLRRIYQNEDRIARADSLYQMAGNPNIMSYNYSRAQYNPFSNTIFLGNMDQDQSDFEAEVSHALQFNNKKVGLNQKGIPNLLNYNSLYQDPLSFEYDAHKVIQPRINEYIMSGKYPISSLIDSINHDRNIPTKLAYLQELKNKGIKITPEILKSQKWRDYIQQSYVKDNHVENPNNYVMEGNSAVYQYLLPEIQVFPEGAFVPIKEAISKHPIIQDSSQYLQK